jgi:hypothetical protein
VGIDGPNFQPSTLAHQSRVALGSELASSVWVIVPLRIGGGDDGAGRFAGRFAARAGLVARTARAGARFFAAFLGAFLAVFLALFFLADFFAAFFERARLAMGPSGRYRERALRA